MKDVVRDCCNFNCRQGRDCPNRVRVPNGKWDWLIDLLLAATVVGIVYVIAAYATLNISR